MEQEKFGKITETLMKQLKQELISFTLNIIDLNSYIFRFPATYELHA